MKRRLLGSLIGLSIFLGGTVSYAFENISTTQTSSDVTWTTWLDGEPIENFKEPYSVTVDPKGAIYILQRQVEKRGLDGNLLWSKYFTAPRTLVIDKNGNLYLSDLGWAQIEKMTPDGVWTTVGDVYNGFARPFGIAIDSKGNLYVSDSEKNNVQKWSVADQKWDIWIEGDLKNPSGIAVDSKDNLYISSTDQNQIQKWSPEGTLLETWPSGKESFYHPVDITIDSEDNFYVSEAEKNRIQMRKSDGTWLILGTDFYYPFGMSVDNNHNIYVADIGNNRIQKANLDKILTETTNTVVQNNAENKVKLLINSLEMSITKNNAVSSKQLDTAPLLINNSAMVPLRGVLEELGASINFIADQNKVIIEKDSTKVELVIGSNQAVVNDSVIKLDQPPVLLSNRTFVPLRFVSQSLDYNVTWDNVDQSITIK